MPDLEEKRRMVRGLLGARRGFAETHGFAVTNNPGALFQLLCLSVLLAGRRSHRSAVVAARALRDHGAETARGMAAMAPTDRAALLAEAGLSRQADVLADVL